MLEFQFKFFMWTLFMHCIGDYIIQSDWLQTFKQKKSWEEHPQYAPKYKYDYIVALFVHSWKANALSINLIQDQLLHLAWIVIQLALYAIPVG